MKNKKFKREEHFVQKISPETFFEIWKFAAHFYVDTREHFERDLNALSKVILIRDKENGALKGIVTIKYFSFYQDGKKIIIIYSEEGYILPEYRGTNRIQWLGLKEYINVRLSSPGASIFWALPVVSRRGYLLVTCNFYRYWPRHDHAIPHAIKNLMDMIGRWVVWGNWDNKKGLLCDKTREKFPSPEPMTLTRQQQHDVQFFEQRNPSHREGDCLLCIVPLTVANMSCVGIRMAYRWLRRIKKSFYGGKL
jgi:hypothetical protein